MKKRILSLILAFSLLTTGFLIPALHVSADSSLTPFSPSLEMFEAADGMVGAFAADASIKVATMKIKSPVALMNGKQRNIDTANNKVTPIISNGRTMVPLRFCGDVLGAKTQYISKKDFITVTLGDKQAKFKIGSKSMQIVDTKSGKVLKKVTLDAAPLVSNTRTIVPIRAITEGLGSKVKYQTIGLLEAFVVISSADLSAQQRTETIYNLQKLNAWTYKNQAGTYQLTYPKGWGVIKETTSGTVSAVAINEKHLDSMIETQDVTAAMAKNYVDASKSDIEKAYGTVTGFAKITINGKKAVLFTCTQIGPAQTTVDGKKAVLSSNQQVSMCVVSSAKSGMVIMLTTIQGAKAPTDQFKTIYNSIKMLK